MDYKEKYEQALKVAKETYDKQPMYRDWLGKMFPELAESEDDKIYGMAVHYYDEDEIDPKYLKKVGGTVVVNHQVRLTDEEKAELEKKAKDDYYREMMEKQRKLNQHQAKKDGERVETVEVDMSDYHVVQSRGKHNQHTPYHDTIMKLMNDNMGMIKEINDKKRRVI